MGCIKMLRKALIWCKNALYKLQTRVKPAGESSLFPSDASLPSPPAVQPPSTPSPWLLERQRGQQITGDPALAQDPGLYGGKVVQF